MHHKPKTFEEYERGQFDLVLMTCRELSTVLGDFVDEIVIVGGLVPTLIIDQANLSDGVDPHVGTMDIDLGLSVAVYDDQLYQNITDRLRQRGFGPDVNDKGNPTSQRWFVDVHGAKVTVDFLIPAENDDKRKPRRFRNLEKDFAALPTDGLMLAFEDSIEVSLSGPTTRGEMVTDKRMRVCGPGAYIVLKSIAFANGGENKDAYDLFYTIRNFGSGPEDVAKRFLALGSNEYCERAILTLKNDFCGINSVGVRRAAAFLLGETADDDDLNAEIMAYFVGFVASCERR